MVAFLLPLYIVACQGEIGFLPGPGGGSGNGGADGDPSEAPVVSPEAFECDPGTTAGPDQLRRLTRVELENALEDIFAELDPGTRSWVPREVERASDQVPPDLATEALDYRRMSQEVSQAHVDGGYAVALRLADALTSDLDRLRSTVGDCAADGDRGNDDACLEAWVRDFGELAFRRPLTDDEVALYVDPIDPAAMDAVDRVRLTTTAMLMAPPFVYQIELGDEPVAGSGDAYRLTSYELATRLALTFWRSTPDGALLAAARSGELDDQEGYRGQVERMLADPRAERAMAGFFEDWLTLHRVPELDSAVGRADFRAYAGDDLPDARLRDEVLAELLAFTRHVYVSDGGVSDLFLSRASFVESEAVASLYGGVPVWSEGEPPVMLPAEERAGLLTRAAVLANDQATTRPILRGVRVLTRVLCDEVELPENMDDIELPENDGSRTTREKVAALTEQEGSVCNNCHQAINPLGFAFEGFDGLGRVRTEEAVYGEDGALLNAFPVDTSVEVRLEGRGDPVPISGGVELSESLAESPKVAACVARQLTRHALGRRENLRADGCMLEAVRGVLAEGGSLRDALVALAESPSFQQVQK